MEYDVCMIILNEWFARGFESQCHVPPFYLFIFLYQFISNEHLNKYNNDPWPLVLFPKKEMDITLHNCYLDVFMFSFDLNESFT